MSDKSKMTKAEALLFFAKHFAWCEEQWSHTPEGSRYRQQFLEALQAIEGDKC